MKFTINSNIFNEALKKVEKGLPKIHKVKILENILVNAECDRLILITTDLNNTIKVVIPDIHITEQGKTMLDKNTIKVLNKLKDQDLEFANNNIKAGKRNIKFAELDAESYPKIENDFNKLFTLDNPLELFKIKYASSKDELRPVFNSIYLNGDKIISTDTHRMSIRELNFDTEVENTIINISTIDLIYKIFNKKLNSLDVDINKEYNRITFKNDDVEVMGRLVEGSFPDYKRIVPGGFKGTVTVNRKTLLEELKFVEPGGKKGDCVLQLGIKDNNLDIFTQNANNKLESTINITNDSNFKTFMAFNIKYCMDILNNFESEYIELKFNGEFAPLTVVEKGKTDILLPIRIEKCENSKKYCA